MKENDRIRLQHILIAIEEIESFTTGVNLSTFQENKMIRNASVRSLEIIGEAIAAISEEFKVSNVDIPWQDWKNYRNVLIHQYFGIDYQMVFSSIKDDIPELKRKINEIMEQS